jgi:hypothetical protein
MLSSNISQECTAIISVWQKLAQNPSDVTCSIWSQFSSSAIEVFLQFFTSGQYTVKCVCILPPVNSASYIFPSLYTTHHCKFTCNFISILQGLLWILTKHLSYKTDYMLSTFVFPNQFNTYKTVKSRSQLYTMKMLKCACWWLQFSFVFLICLMMTSGIYFYI